MFCVLARWEWFALYYYRSLLQIRYDDRGIPNFRSRHEDMKTEWGEKWGDGEDWGDWDEWGEWDEWDEWGEDGGEWGWDDGGWGAGYLW